MSSQVFAPPAPPAFDSPPLEGFQGSVVNGVPNWFSAMLQNGNSRSSFGSRECLSVLPINYRNAVIDMTSEYGNPDPQMWYLTVKPSKNAFGLRYLEVQHGQIVKDTGFSIFANIFWSHKPMLLDSNFVDSRMVYEKARSEAASRGHAVSNAIFQLKKHGKTQEPYWTAWGYGSKDAYLGLIEVRASDGAIISIKGFK